MAQKQKKVKYILDHIGYSRDEMDNMSVLGSDDAIYVEFKDENDVDFMASQNSDYPIPVEQLTDVSSVLVYNAATNLTAVTYASGTTRTVTLEMYAIDSASRSYYVTPQTDYITFSGTTGFTYDSSTGVMTIANTVTAGTKTQQLKYTKVGGSTVTGNFTVYMT